ncbi:MAG: biotin-dependent carboxyltransferase family protein, partial [Fusobacterium sp. JB021]|nr:biotin-dependent carboxyltransferase family protein [Fusobacterium sp. JB020]MDP0493640.1 biotin-dependent carboxyltransferase family protein [Fusobacterium sp. JB021]MDP0507315.1 biotin-dependent carboxyltransferase family protein [Fusobacterium sp. JB019]
METFKITDSGLLSSIQDLGRYGYQRYGVSCSGVMDEYSAKIGNFLVGNDENAAVIETTLKGISGEFLKDTLISVTGGDCDVFLNDEKIKLWNSYEVKAGDKLKMGFCKSGLRNYIAFSGGIDVPVVMNSRSTNLKAKIGGFSGRKLMVNDTLSIFELLGKKETKGLKEEFVPKALGEIEVRVILGQQQDYFTKAGIETFFRETYSTTKDGDRMGIRLSGPEVEHVDGADIISDGITFGAIQIPGNGQPIIMMADRQTTGGYTKIGNVITVDLSKLAQAKPGTKVKFKEVDEKEAIRLMREEKELIFSEDSYEIRSKKESFSIILNGKTCEVEIERIK